jgi:hypothetical protein
MRKKKKHFMISKINIKSLMKNRVIKSFSTIKNMEWILMDLFVSSWLCVCSMVNFDILLKYNFIGLSVEKN